MPPFFSRFNSLVSLLTFLLLFGMLVAGGIIGVTGIAKYIRSFIGF